MQGKMLIYVPSASSNHCTDLAPPAFHPVGFPMVNYDDPAVVAQDFCAYAFEVKHARSWNQLTSIDSDSVEALACPGWTLLVCLPRRAGPLLSSECPIIIVWLFKSSWEFVTTF